TAVEQIVETGAAFQYVAARIDALLGEQRGEGGPRVAKPAVDGLGFAASDGNCRVARAFLRPRAGGAVLPPRREGRDPPAAAAAACEQPSPRVLAASAQPSVSSTRPLSTGTSSPGRRWYSSWAAKRAQSAVS